jgi:acyl-CoA synthetase (NDP forming)
VVFAALDEGAKFPQHYVVELRELGVAFYPSPERAFRALARLSVYAGGQGERESERARPEGLGKLPDGVIPEYRSKKILASLGMRVPRGELAKTVAEAKTIAARLGYPVVLKAQSARLSHKSDAGGVALKLTDDLGIEAAWHKMLSDIANARPGLALDGILVEEMGAWGVELIVGAHNDADWGPVLLVGFGGVVAEALHDIRFIPPDLSVDGIVAEIMKLRSAVLLREFRGSAALDVGAAAQLVHRLGTLMMTCPEVREVDINPLIVYQEGRGAVALDALIVTGMPLSPYPMLHNPGEPQLGK